MTDEKIINAIRNRDEAVMGLVMEKYAKLLWSVASAVLANTASAQDVEECVADAFIHLWQYPEKYQPDKGKLSSWLAMVTRSKAIDRYRQLARKPEIPMEAGIPIHSSAAFGQAVSREERQQLWECVDSLKEPDREILIRRFYREQKPKEIAVALDMPKKQVENALYQAKLRLKRMLTEKP